MNTSMSRWHARRTFRGQRAAVTLTAFAVLAGSQLAIPASASAESSTSYEDQTYPAAGATPPTADKPQSKLWFTDGTWWALMRNSTPGTDGTVDVTVHELMSDHTWRDTGVVVDRRASSTGDALWENGKLLVASRATSGAIQVARMSFNAGQGQFTMDTGFPVEVANSTVESVTINRDSKGRLWVAWAQPDVTNTLSDRVMVAHTTGDDRTWTAPFAVPVDDNLVAEDDIATLTTFGGKVGVMYSDQTDQKVHFAVHPDGSADNAGWTLETALDGTRSADDHLNLKSLLDADDGRVYAAIKTSQGDDPSDPASSPDIRVLTRSSDGSWTSATVATVRDNMTRPQLALDATNREVYVVMATESGGSVYYKKSPMGAKLSFSSGGPGTTLISYPGAMIDDPTTSKAPVTSESGLVVLASDDVVNHRYYHAEMKLDAAAADTAAPSTPTQVTATAGGSGVTVSWAAATDNTGVASYRVIRSGATVAGSVTGTSFVDSSAQAGQTYSYTVSAVDAAGNRSAESAAATVTVQASPGTPGSSKGTFTDVPPGAPFAGDIEWLAAEGIAKGNADGTFRPNSPVIRQAMAVFLFHFANRTAPVPSCSTSPYPDVPRSSLYCGSIDWLSTAGITRGTADGNFRPLGTVTRQAMAVFIYHLANNGATPPACTTAVFKDVPASSSYCGAVSWLSQQGLTTSKPGGNFNPTGSVTRGMMAAFLHRYDGQ
jgi:hypothetical protein